MGESHFQRVTRQGIEKNITDAYESNDEALMNHHLQLYPYGKERQPISEELARHIADMSLQDTIEFEAL